MSWAWDGSWRASHMLYHAAHGLSHPIRAISYHGFGNGWVYNRTYKVVGDSLTRTHIHYQSGGEGYPCLRKPERNSAPSSDIP